MSTVYLCQQGAKVSRQGRRLLVSQDDQEILGIPLHRIDRLVFMGRVQITESALALLLDRRVPLVLTSQIGRLRGVLVPPDTPHVQLRKNQYRLSEQPEYVLAFCKDLVAARADSAISVIRRFAYNHPDARLDNYVQQIQSCRQAIDAAGRLDSLRGVEGIIARQYFAALSEMFGALGTTFEGRVRRPPTDPVNAALSFVYVLLTDLAACALHVMRLDIFCGIMHAENRNAPALALDFVEQFRQPLADRFVMWIFNKRILQPPDFQPLPNGQGMLLSDAARRRLIAEWEQFLDKPQRLCENQTAPTPRELIFQQAERLEQAFAEQKPYRHFRLSLK